jgi:hypothetical protein
MTTAETNTHTDIKRIHRTVAQLLPKSSEGGEPYELTIEYGVRKVNDEDTPDCSLWDWEETELEDTMPLTSLNQWDIIKNAGLAFDLYCYLSRDIAFGCDEQHSVIVKWDGRKWVVM